MAIKLKTFYKMMLGWVSLWCCAVVATYSVPKTEPAVKNDTVTKTIQECRDDVCYGAIRNIRLPIESASSKGGLKDFKIPLAALNSGTMVTGATVSFAPLSITPIDSEIIIPFSDFPTV